MSSMVDRPKAVVAGAVLAIGVLFLLGVGFVAGRASGDDDETADTGPELSGDGLPAGPTGLNGGVPVGFAHSEDGALSAAVAWVPWFLSGPASERPAGIEEVLADDVEPPSDELMSSRVQFSPLAVAVEMDSDDIATVTLFGPVLEGALGAELGGEFWSLPVTLAWDDDAGDWRLATLFPEGPAGDFILNGPVDAEDLEGFGVLRPIGAVAGPEIVQVVPGE